MKSAKELGDFTGRKGKRKEGCLQIFETSRKEMGAFGCNEEEGHPPR